MKKKKKKFGDRFVPEDCDMCNKTGMVKYNSFYHTCPKCKGIKKYFKKC